MNKIFRTIVLYVIALAMGVGLFFLVRPYAMANRENPSRPGGEYLMIVLPAAVVAVVRCIKKDKDVFTSRDEDDE